MIGLALAVELLHFSPQSSGTARLFEALIAAAPAAGVELVESPSYRGRSDWLLLWGPGAPNRFEAMRRQIAAGGHVIAWDAAYWQRDRKFRVSVNGAHPQAWVMKKPWPASRLAADAVRVADVFDPTGPVIVAGIGDKARVQYGADVVDTWERARIQEAQAAGREIVYRQKRQTGAPPIEQALQGASAVITYHSNVAVDAIRLGIPVLCRDGIASAVCASRWPVEGLRPLPATWRDRFLNNVAWFQWAPSEAAACWTFLRELLS